MPQRTDSHPPSVCDNWRRFLLFAFLVWSYAGPPTDGFHVWYTAAFPASWVLVGTTGPTEMFFDITGTYGFYTVSSFVGSDDAFAL